MTRTRTIWSTCLAAFILAAIFFVLENYVHTFELINLKGRDIFFRLQHDLLPHPFESDKLVLVTVDDDTLKHIPSRWPFPRSYYAQLLDNLRPFSPKAVGFDLVFSGNDYSPESDKEFARALKDSGNVVVASYQSKHGEMNIVGAVRENAAAVGVVDKLRDYDRLIRHALLARSFGAEALKSWELALFDQAFRDEPNKNVPTNEVAPINFQLRFNEFKQIPLWKILAKDFAPHQVGGKIVLVGLTGEVFHDIHGTPLGTMPGLAVNANTLVMLMSNGFFSYVPLGFRAALGFLALWLVLILTLTVSAVMGLSAVLFLSIIFLAFSFFLFTNQLIIDFWFLIVGMFLTLIGAIVYRQGQLFLENLRLQEESARDPLTGFYSRRFLELKLRSELAHMLHRGGGPRKVKEVSVVMIDLDNFKLVNDTFGHGEGDRVLKTMATAIRSSVRKEELICRFGGDEFCVILSNTSIETAAKFAEKLRNLIAQNPDLVYRTASGVDTIRVTGSIGVASVTGAKVTDPDKLMKAADRALYRAKAGGRNQVCIFDPKRDVIE